MAMYEPIDMLGSTPGVAYNAKECQALCAATPRCKHFTYYPAARSCHLEDAWAVLRLGRWGFIAGPVACDEPGGGAATATATTSAPIAIPEEIRGMLPEDDFCCMATEAADVCGTCPLDKRAALGVFCGLARANCEEACGQVWCSGKPATRPANGTDASAEGSGAAAESTTAVPAEPSASSTEGRCPTCAPRVHASPDVVIPLWEHDLCKVKVTAKSIAVHDPKHMLGDVLLLWVSTRPSSEYQAQLDDIRGVLSGTHVVKIMDFSQQLNSHPIQGWFAQQILKLKVASAISSDYYIVLDSKNALIRDVDMDIFFTGCNQGKISGEYRHDRIPGLHAHWYAASANALHLDAPSEGYWPASITPVVMHKQTVLDMLQALGEDPSTDQVSSGPLLQAITDHSRTGYAATEFTLYLVFARSRPDFACIHAVERHDSFNLGDKWAVSLWRGVRLQDNLGNVAKIMSGQEVPLMFGAQASALQGMPAEKRGGATRQIIQLYQNAGLYSVDTPPAEFVRCVIGPLEEPTTTTAPTTVVTSVQAPPQAPPAPPATGEFCCTATTDESNYCGACYPGARAGPENYCGVSRARCAGCHKVWCAGGAPAPPAAAANSSGGGGLRIVMKQDVRRDTGAVRGEPRGWPQAARVGVGAAVIAGAAAAIAAMTAARRTRSWFVAGVLSPGARRVPLGAPLRSAPAGAALVATSEELACEAGWGGGNAAAAAESRPGLD